MAHPTRCLSSSELNRSASKLQSTSIVAEGRVVEKSYPYILLSFVLHHGGRFCKSTVEQEADIGRGEIDGYRGTAACGRDRLQQQENCIDLLFIL